MTAGTMSTRLVLNRAHINASMHKLPHIVKMQQEIRRISDSIRSVRPDLSPDSVLRLAYENDVIAPDSRASAVCRQR